MGRRHADLRRSVSGEQSVSSEPAETGTTARLIRQIRAATHTLVLIGESANTRHQFSEKIRTRNWIWWEIEQSKAEGNRLIAVKLKASNPTPDPLLDADVTWATPFTQEAILKACNDA